MSPQSLPARAFMRGLRDGAPFALVVVPFGVLFGVVATEAGLNLTEVMAFSILVIAGASQLAALQLMQENAPAIIVLATALAVNLRLAMYSAALTPHLGAARGRWRVLMAYFLVDQTFAASAAEYERRPSATLPEKVLFFLGVAVPVCLPWYGATWIGARLGQGIPPEYALDFAVPVTFLAMIAPMLRSLPHLAAAFVSVAGTLALAFLPYGSGLLIAAIAALFVGAAVEEMLERKGIPDGP
ncbi:MAG: AzlC family ABC transporter permease [Gemmobacter sp.]